MKYTLIITLILVSVISQAETVACFIQLGTDKVTRVINANESVQDVPGILVSAKPIQSCSMTCSSSLFIEIAIGDDLKFSHEAYTNTQMAPVPGALIQGSYKGKDFFVHCAKP